MKRTIVAVLLTASLPAGAADLYATAAVGRATGSIQGAPDVSSTTARIGAGIQMQRNIAIEGGWAELGNASLPGGHVSASGPYASVVLSAHPASWVSPHIKAGIGHTTTTTPLGQATNTTPTYGAGATFHLTKNLGIRAEVERFQKVGSSTVGEARITTMTMGLQVRF